MAEEPFDFKPNAKIVWLGKQPFVEEVSSKKGISKILTFHDRKESFEIKVNQPFADWLLAIIKLISVNNAKVYTLQEIKKHYEQEGLDNFELFWYSKPMNTLREYGLLSL